LIRYLNVLQLEEEKKSQKHQWICISRFEFRSLFKNEAEIPNYIMYGENTLIGLEENPMQMKSFFKKK